MKHEEDYYKPVTVGNFWRLLLLLIKEDYYEALIKEDYYKPVTVGNFWRNKYVEYENNDDRNKTLSIEEYLNKIRPNLKEIINNIKLSDT